MRLLPVLFLVAALAGCVGDGSDPPGPHDAPPTDADPSTPPADAPQFPEAPPQADGSHPTFVGTECVQMTFFTEVPVDRARPHIPQHRHPFGPTTAVSSVAFGCAAASLGNDTLPEDVNLLLTYAVVATQDNETGATYYVMEALTDWPLLAGHLAASGTPTGLATITVADGDAPRTTVEGDGLAYVLESPIHHDVEENSVDYDRHLLAGPDAEATFHVHSSERVGDDVSAEALLDADGGVLGSILQGPWPGLVNVYTAEVTIEHTR